MNIYRAKEARLETRDWGSIRVLAEISLPYSVSSVSFSHTNTPPNGRIINHLHKELHEFLYFLNPAQIRYGTELYSMYPGDIVMVSPGDPHEVLAGSEGVSVFVIKLPNNPRDSERL